MQRIGSSLAFSLAAIAISTSPSLADSQHKICIGQYKLNCPSSPVDGYFGCGTTRADAAQQVCTVYNGGVATKLGYSIIPVASAGAGQCNYDVFIVTCYQQGNFHLARKLDLACKRAGSKIEKQMLNDGIVYLWAQSPAGY
jgi:hypothetical protein